MAIKGQVLVDFIIECTPGASAQSDLPEGWTLNVDEALNNKDSEIRIILTTSKGTIIEQSYTLSFPATNNEVEYEAIIAGLR